MRVIVVLLVTLIACSSDALEIGPFLKWLNNPANKLIVVRQINGLKLTAKFLPEDYIRLLAKSRATELAANSSLCYAPDNTINVLLTIAPDKVHAGNDIMMFGVRDPSDYEKRFRELNFHLDEIIRLQTDKGEYLPSYVSLENTFGLTEHRNINIAFSSLVGQPPLKDATYYDIVFEDNVFGTGTSHFVFDKQAIEKTPKLITKQQP